MYDCVYVSIYSMVDYVSASSADSSLSLTDRINVLEQCCASVASFGLSWCPIQDGVQINVPLPESITQGSEEHHQLARAHLRVDEILSLIFQDVSHVAAISNLTTLVKLFWSTAVVGLYNEGVVRAIQNRIQDLMNPNMQPEDLSRLLFAEATFFGPSSALSISVDEMTFASFSLPVQVNVLQCLALTSKDLGLVQALARVMGSTMLRYNKEGSVDRATLALVAPFLARTMAFVGEDLHKLKSVWTLVKRLPSWKYAFELCLACHSAQSKGVELNPFLEDVFPSDVLYVRGRKKIVLELVRPSSVVWRVDGPNVLVWGIDVYTRLARSVLSRKGYRVVTITLTEWLKLESYKARQVVYVKRRIRNCIRERRLFSGVEREEPTSDMDLSESSDSDMSD